MQKKGLTTETYFVIAAVVVAVIMFSGMGAYASEVSTGNDFKKLYLSKDIALLIDSMHVGESNSKFTYQSNQLDTSDLDIKIDQHKVRIFVQGENLETFQTFAEDKNIGFYNRARGPAEVTFAKSNKFDKTYVDSLYCKDTDFTLSGKKLLIDANEQIGWPLRTVQKIIESNPEIISTSASNNEVRSDLQTKMKQVDAILSLGIGDYDASQNFIKAYINGESQNYLQSRELGCKIGSAIAEISDAPLSIIVVEKDQNIITNTEIPSVFIEMGNKNHPNSNNLAIAGERIVNELSKI